MRILRRAAYWVCRRCWTQNITGSTCISCGKERW